MKKVKQAARTFLNRGIGLFIAILIVATIAPQILSIKTVSAADGGYPWIGAQCIDGTGCSGTYNWGYTPLPCPSNDTTCLSYPYPNGTNPTAGMGDTWGYGVRNCTSYVAWMIKQEFNADISGWGQAYQWEGNATGTGHPYANDASPQIGDIAQWGTEVGGGYGHVAYVYAVNSGVASLAEYNSGLPRDVHNNLQWGLFDNSRTFSSNSVGHPDYYIHIGTLATQSPFVIRTGTDVQGKVNLSGAWSTINGNTAADLRVSGDTTTSRISYTDTNGHVWAKDSLAGSLDGTWVDEYPSPSQYASSPYIFLIRTGTTVSGKVSLGDAWTTLNGSSATDMRMSGAGSITYTATNGHVWAKEWLGGTWYDEYTSPDQYASSDTLFVIRLGTNVYGKASLGNAWTLLNGNSATDVRVNGNRITYTDTNGHVWAKDGLGGTWYDEYTSPSQYAASSTLLLIRTGTDVQAKINLGDSWTTINGNQATDIRVNGNRITYTDTNGHVLAKDYLTGTWYDEYTSPNQYATGDS